MFFLIKICEAAKATEESNAKTTGNITASTQYEQLHSFFFIQKFNYDYVKSYNLKEGNLSIFGSIRGIGFCINNNFFDIILYLVKNFKANKSQNKFFMERIQSKNGK